MPGHRAAPPLLEAAPTTPLGPRAGRRVAAVPVDSRPLETGPAPYVGRRRAAVLDRPAEASLPDTGTIERVLAGLEPVDQTTSFEHEDTARLPLLRDLPAPGIASAPVVARVLTTAGKRRAPRRTGRRNAFGRGLPSAPVLIGIAALAVSVVGTIGFDDPEVAPVEAASITHAASALSGSSATGTITRRSQVVSRDSARDAQADAAGQDLKAAAEGLAVERNAALKQYAAAAEKQAKIIAKDLWGYPLEPVVLTARFGQYGLWSSYHTGLDFNGNTGDSIQAIANGVVTSVGYDGSYGNKTVVTLEDGTELWYCHQSSYGVSVGDTVRQGEVIGQVGATGNVTGSHLHVEVRPGGGDPVDPYTAMQQHGLF